MRQNDSNFEIFKTFVEVVAKTTYRNLQSFRQFSNYTFLRGLDLDMLQIAKEVTIWLASVFKYLVFMHGALLNIFIGSFYTDARGFIARFGIQFGSH